MDVPEYVMRDGRLVALDSVAEQVAQQQMHLAASATAQLTRQPDPLPVPTVLGLAAWGSKVDQAAVRDATRALLAAIGEDPDREGLRDTPDRVARAWAEFIDYDPGTLARTFTSERTDQLVAVTGVRVWSMCEHHLLPFWCDLTIAYLAGDHLIGLSKLARLAMKHAHRLQQQERLVEGIAGELAQLIEVEDVAVLARGVHTCMCSRGVRSDGEMVSSALRGAFLAQGPTRAEFMALATR